MLRCLLSSTAFRKNSPNRFCVAQHLCLLSSLSIENRVSYFDNHLHSTAEPCRAGFAATLPSSFSSKGIVVVSVFACVILELNEPSLSQFVLLFACQKIVIRITCSFYFLFFNFISNN